jgi:hypothetical protein
MLPSGWALDFCPRKAESPNALTARLAQASRGLGSGLISSTQGEPRCPDATSTMRTSPLWWEISAHCLRSLMHRRLQLGLDSVTFLVMGGCSSEPAACRWAAGQLRSGQPARRPSELFFLFLLLYRCSSQTFHGSMPVRDYQWMHSLHNARTTLANQIQLMYSLQCVTPATDHVGPKLYVSYHIDPNLCRHDQWCIQLDTLRTTAPDTCDSR